MKTISFLIIGLFLLVYCNPAVCKDRTDNQPASSGETAIKVSSSPECYNLISAWAAEYGKQYPGHQIIVSSISDPTVPSGDLRFLSTSSEGKGKNANAWKLVMGRDVIIPLVNAKNPLLTEILRQGISSQKFTALLTNPANQNWNAVMGGSQHIPVHIYLNEEIKTNLANFINTDPSLIKVDGLASAQDVFTSVQKDINSIGFCRLADFRTICQTQEKNELQLLPVDKNGNGRIDGFENIYGNLEEFTRGVWIGKYPASLCGDITVSAASRPADKATVAFLSWILSDGQKYLAQNGYTDLAANERKASLDALTGTEIAVASSDEPVMSQTWLIILTVLLISGLIITPVIRYRLKNKSTSGTQEVDLTPALDENAIVAPNGLYFDKTHTWAFMEKDGDVKVGIDDFLQHITGTITRIKMKEPGEKVRKGEKIMTITRNGKQLEIYTPVSGTIKENNRMLLTDSSLVNTSPYSEGWVYRIEPKNWLREIQFMFMGERYKEWLHDEFSRLKDFFAASVRSNTSVYAHIVLQDGGELTDNVLAELGPEVWEDFQTQFIDTSK